MKDMVSNIKKNIRVLGIVTRASLIRMKLYKADMIAKFVRAGFVLSVQLLLIYVVFNKNSTIYGWSADQYLLLIGIYNFVNYFAFATFATNLFRLGEKIIKGDFDFYFLLPIDTGFIASFAEIFPEDMVVTISGIIPITYFIVKHFSELSFVNLLYGGLSIILAVVIMYSLILFFSSFQFIFKSDIAMHSLIHRITSFAVIPPDFVNYWLAMLLYTLVPLAFIATVPAQVFVSSNALNLLGTTFIVAVIAVIFSNSFWQFASKKYVSFGG